jgi:MarR family 2-MHQ and catechol resistance regulon transcriptional repressor
VSDADADQDVVDFVAPLGDTFGGVDELAVAVHYLVVRTHAAFTATLGREAESMDMSPARLGVLKLLYYMPDRRLPMKEIGDRLAVTAGNITRLVSGLVAQGYIERVTPDADRRTTFAQITRAGAEVFEATMPPILRATSELQAPLEQNEKLELIRLLSKLRSALQRSD